MKKRLISCEISLFYVIMTQRYRIWGDYMKSTFDWQKESQTQWDNQAISWSERSSSLWKGGNRKDIIAFIEKHFEKGSKMYDIGCGDGYASYQLHHAGFDVTGIDISRKMIALAKEKYAQEKIPFLQGDLIELPLENNSCDGLMAINALEWIEVPAKGISELERVVKKGGFMCIAVLGPTAGPRAKSFPRLHGHKAVCNTMMPWEFQQLVAEYNLEYVDGFGVYKKGVEMKQIQHLPLELKQALSFMWVFMLRKAGDAS